MRFGIVETMHVLYHPPRIPVKSRRRVRQQYYGDTYNYDTMQVQTRAMRTLTRFIPSLVFTLESENRRNVK
jgi:hypothetical protein